MLACSDGAILHACLNACSVTADGTALQGLVSRSLRNAPTDVCERLVFDGENAIGILGKFVESEHGVVRRGHYVVIFAWEH
jgi:hypothetical protein